MLSLLAGAAPVNPALTLADLIGAAVLNNKDLSVARYAVEGARARLLQAGVPPNPRLEIFGRNDVMFSNDGEYAVSIGFSQDFPVAGRIARQRDIARVDIALALAEIAQADRRLAGEVAAAYYRLLVLDRQIVAQKHLIEVNTELVRVIRNRLQTAEVSEIDIATAQLELQRSIGQRYLLQTQWVAQIALLNQLLGRTASEPLDLDLALPMPGTPPDLDTLQRQALSARPDLRTEYLNADRARADQALARAERWEDWTVRVDMEQDRLVLDDGPPQSPGRAIGLSLSIPLPLKNSRQGRIAEALSAGAQADARVQALEFSIGNEVTRLHTEVTHLEQPLLDYQRELLPAGESNVTLVQQAYRQGLAPIFTVIQAQRQQSDVTQAYLDILDRYLQALAMLHTAAATYTQHLGLPEDPAPVPSSKGN
ncbi:MAG: TolC family protein [Gammaproteobacteria bacterium]|nr:TolC family protein [Gammaproteobacteria bacterium]